MFLLSGDTIVNESMLTGESVPVGKVPASDAEISKWKDAKDVTGGIAKNFLYYGTKVVRIRGALAADGSMGRPALALVVRTGEWDASQRYRRRQTECHFRLQHDQGLFGTINAFP